MNSNSEGNKAAAGCEYQDNLDILRQVDFFSGLPLEATKVLAYLCTRETFKPQEVLFEQDEEDERAYCILSGQVRLMFKDDGKEQVIRSYGQSASAVFSGGGGRCGLPDPHAGEIYQGHGTVSGTHFKSGQGCRGQYHRLGKTFFDATAARL